MPELDLDKAMQNFRNDPTIEKAFNVRSHIHPDIPGQENADVYLAEVNRFIATYLSFKKSLEIK
jgi:hypothetical protein